jgi:hypothetical protein
MSVPQPSLRPDLYSNSVLQTFKDNLRLFTPEVLERMNRVVVQAGHAL